MYKKESERRGKKEVLNRNKIRTRKAAAQKEYEAANKAVKKSVRRDKKKYFEDLAQQAEDATGKNYLKELYLTTKKLTGKFKQIQVHIKEDQLQRWTEHFRQPPQLTAEIPPAPNLLEIN